MPDIPSTKQRPLEAYAALLTEAEQVRGQSLGAMAWRRLRTRWTAMVALAFLVSLVLLALLTPLLPLQPPRAVSIKLQYQPPQLNFWHESAYLPASLEEEGALKLLQTGYGIEDLGTISRWLLERRIDWFGKHAFDSWFGRDHLGRDVLSRICWGTRLSLAVAFVATLVSLTIGVTYGAIAGYFGGWLDNLMMRFVDVLYSIPFIFIAIFAMTILNDDAYRKSLAEWGIDRMVIFFMIIGALFWLTMSRVVRGQVLALKQQQFVEAAKSLGASSSRIIARHLIPNLLSIVIVYLTLTIPNVILVEASLSYLGLGVRPPDVSWGLLAQEGVVNITPIKITWWLVAFPGATIALTLYSLNFLGDGLRDALDPRLKK